MISSLFGEKTTAAKVTGGRMFDAHVDETAPEILGETKRKRLECEFAGWREKE